MDPAENDRRVVSVLHVGFLAAVPIYAFVLWVLRSSVPPATPSVPRGGSVFLPLAALGVAQYLVAGALGRRLLRRTRGFARDRVRSFFLIRMAAAEAIGAFGLILGLRGGSALEAAALFILAMLALAASAPFRTAWEAALRAASGDPG
jgi:hypothetical protein